MFNPSLLETDVRFQKAHSLKHKRTLYYVGCTAQPKQHNWFICRAVSTNHDILGFVGEGRKGELYFVFRKYLCQVRKYL